MPNLRQEMTYQQKDPALDAWAMRSEESEISSGIFSRDSYPFSKKAGMLYLKANRRQMKADG
jgi:hypothetical protein